MKVLFLFIASALAASLHVPAQASRGLPADIETLDQLWQQYNMSCKQGNQNACELKDTYQRIIKQNFPNAVPAMCPDNIRRGWFKTGREGWPLVAKCFSGSNQSKRRDLNSHHEKGTQTLDDLVIYFTYTAKC